MKDRRSILVKELIQLIGAIVRVVTGRPLLMRTMEFLLNQRALRLAVNRALNRMVGLVTGVSDKLEKYMGMTLEDLIIRLLSGHGRREGILNILTMSKPVMEGLEPEVLWVLREVLRIDGVKEDMLPMVLSTGSVFVALFEPEVIERSVLGYGD